MKIIKAKYLINFVLCILLTVTVFYIISFLSEAGEGSFVSSGQVSEKMPSEESGTEQPGNASRQNSKKEEAQNGDKSREKNPAESAKPPEKTPSENDSAQTIQNGVEMNGVWVASVGNINFPSKKGSSSEILKKEIDDMVETVKKGGLNTIIFQVRPASDALYDSSIFPVSEYVTGKQGEPLPGGFDPLLYIIERAHQNGIYLHAWINPYRVTTGTKSAPKHDVSALSPKNPARLHPEWTVPYADGKLYYNPGLPEVRELIISGVLEIVKKYHVDGIHFDDYFYPYPVKDAKFNDDEAYKKYGKDKTLDNFRRESVNALIKDVYAAIKKQKPSVLFGVSPFGIWANKSSNKLGSDTNGTESYSALYADSYAWVKNEWLDYITPQIYWSMKYKPAPFDKLCDWWSGVVSGTSVKFIPGHGIYKLGDADQIKTDKAWDDKSEIIRQIDYARRKNGYAGSLFYGYQNIKENKKDIFDSLSDYYGAKTRVMYYPPRGIILAAPPEGEVIDAGHIHLMGAAPPGNELRLDNRVIATDEYGFFSVFLPLIMGENTFVFNCGQDILIHKVTRIAPKKERLFDADGIFPKGDAVYYGSGDIWVCARAREGSSVSVSLCGQRITLSHKGGGVYEGMIKIPRESGDAHLGRAVFTAVRGKDADTVKSGTVRLERGFCSAIVTAGETRLLSAPKGAVYEDAGFLPKGAADDLFAADSEHALLACGFLVNKSDIAVSETERDPPPPLANNIYSGILKDKGEKTLLIFDMSLPVPFLFHETDRYIGISVFYTAKENVKVVKTFKNTIFSHIETLFNENTAEYRLYYAKGKGLSGYDVNYIKSGLSLEFAHPPKQIRQKAPLGGVVIALDAGHGGAKGAVGPMWYYGPVEDDLNLDMVFLIKDRLEDMGAAVYISRGFSGAVQSIEEKMNFYREISPHLAVSVHFNSMGRGSDGSLYKGGMAFYTALFSKSAAEAVLRGISAYTDRPVVGALRASYAITRAKAYPSILLELGFLNNISEYGWYLKAQNRRTVADAVAKGIRGYFCADRIM